MSETSQQPNAPATRIGLTTGPETGLDTDACLKALEQGDQSPELLAAALQWRREDQERLFEAAREARDAVFRTREVEVRSVVEISNVCNQTCLYCSMAKGSGIKRYMIKLDDLKESVAPLYESGRRVLLVQSGENISSRYVDFCEKCVSDLAESYPDLEIILCLGNLPRDDYKRLRDAGASRYVLKFETANPDLYETVKPNDDLDTRLECLETLLELGYHVGSGNMVGLPGQTLDDLVTDLLCLGRYRLAMSSTTVFVPGEKSTYKDQPFGDIETTLNFLALIRILFPDRLIPSTSSLEKAKVSGQYIGLMAGANTVTVHDATPGTVKSLFAIYSTKRFTPGESHLFTAVAHSGLKPAEGGLIHDNYR